MTARVALALGALLLLIATVYTVADPERTDS